MANPRVVGGTSDGSIAGRGREGRRPGRGGTASRPRARQSSGMRWARLYWPGPHQISAIHPRPDRTRWYERTAGTRTIVERNLRPAAPMVTAAPGTPHGLVLGVPDRMRSSRPSHVRRTALRVADLGSASRRVALAVALLFGSTSVATLAIPAHTLAWDGGTFSADSEAELVALTNRSRANAGLKALKVDATLRSVARWRSQDMIERDYFSHTIPGYAMSSTNLARSGSASSSPARTSAGTPTRTTPPRPPSNRCSWTPPDTGRTSSGRPGT